MRRLIALIFLASCAPGNAPQAGRQAVDMAGLRNCATITTSCIGLNVVAAAQPNICENSNGPICFTNSKFGTGREFLGAMQLQNGSVCAFRRVAGTTKDVAILGHIVKSADGTIQYERANFPKNPNDLAGVLSSVTLRAACLALR